jgi:hypothetical protein
MRYFDNQRFSIRSALPRNRDAEDTAVLWVSTIATPGVPTRFDLSQSTLRGTVITKQALLWTLTAYRKRTAEMDGWSNVGIFRQSVRDGAGIFLGVSGMYSFFR